MNQIEQRNAAKEFVERWQAAEGNEQRESNKFWIEFMQLLGVPNPTYVLDFERKVQGKRIDVFYEDMGVLIENKSRGTDLDAPEQRGKNRDGSPRMVTPYEQAKWYADNIVPRAIAPKWIVTCNFDQIRIHDLDNEKAETEYETILLEEVPELLYRFTFLTKKENSRLEREKDLSVKAGVVVGKLYDAFAKRYNDIENDKAEQRSLNMLITRIVFLLYAEDAGLFEHQAFYSYLKEFPTQHMAGAMRELFKVLKTPDGKNDLPDERAGMYLADDLAAFPYVNGGLFEEDILIPQFDDDMRFTLLQEASAEFDWSKISPTIFGAVFESTLNPETRRAGGMHYTSIENIHKVTGPLFYDELKDELTAIEGMRNVNERNFKLRAFREKLGKIKVLDPACGSGNFLTETYLSFRKLENRVLTDLYGEQTMLLPVDPIEVTVDQFYGIEINDFAVEVAKTALWIAELQMLHETREIMNMWIDELPLKSNDNIHCANALRIDWNDVIPANECDYIIGNPPFLGYSNLNGGQKEERTTLFGSISTVDYVACWYIKASSYTKGFSIRCAFVSTNSICQGQQVKPIWDRMFDEGNHIDFAWRTFIWNSEAVDEAHVHCVIIGFSRVDGIQPRLYMEDGSVRHVSNINGYLEDKENISLPRRSKPISNVFALMGGFKPADGGNLLLEQEDKDELLNTTPSAAKWIRRFSMGAEYINGIPRYCLWLYGADAHEYMAVDAIAHRVNAVREFRLASKKKATNNKAQTPGLFAEMRETNLSSYIAIPVVSSGRREYVPIGFVTDGMIPGNKLFVLSDATLYDFGILSSQIHNAWIRSVAGRLKSDYSYSSNIVYNNFIWPEPTEPQRQHIEWCAQQVLDARDNYPDKSLADLYDPDKMPSDLRQAHQDLDNAVEVAYGVNFGGDEEKIVAHLFKLYAEATKGE